MVPDLITDIMAIDALSVTSQFTADVDDDGRTTKSCQKAMQISRRALIAGSAAPFALPAQKRPQLAAIVTEIRKHSHGQHIVDRFLEGYGWNGTHHHPAMDLVALYVDQHPDRDLTP